MFAMCSATDSFDIALSAEGVDICEPMFDGDPSDGNYQTKIDFTKTFAFTSFDRELIKTNVLVLGENLINEEARYIHGQKGKGFYTFYGGHDPEDYQHNVGDEPTVLDLHPNSPGYRLILNNVLFPAAKKKKQKT